MNAHVRTVVTIGALARSAGVGVDTVRYYEREGLLPKPARTASGYRTYAPATASRLRFIRRAKDLGFSLGDIRDLLALSSDRDQGVGGVRQRAQARLDEVEQRLRELRRMRRGLKDLIDACPGEGALESCPILGALDGRATP
jgi:MerR family copper efflux transcriptional regulator